MQEINILLVQTQTVMAQLAFQLAMALGLVLLILVVALRGDSSAAAWRGLFALVARLALALGVIWLAVLAIAWPALLERAGNVLGPMVAGLSAIMLATEALQQFLVRRSRSGLRFVATVMTIIGFTATLVLALAAMAWLREPSGVVLIDGRYQVTEWAQMFNGAALFQSGFATVFVGVLLAAALTQWASNREPATILSVPERWRRMMAGIGVVGLLGLFWLLTRAVGAQLNPATQTTQTFYEALLAGSGGLVLRITFVLWIVTLAGVVLSLAQSKPTNRLGRLLVRMPVFGVPVLWALVGWQLFFETGFSRLAGLPVADLASNQPLAALCAGLLLVSLVVLLSFWLMWRFLDRLTELSVAHRAKGGA